MSITIRQADARDLPLEDGSVDLIVTSPPYFALRDYRDGGASLAGQIGAEPTPREYVDALIDCTREWVRVLKPCGSIFVVLGDKYANDAKWGGRSNALQAGSDSGAPGYRQRMVSGIPAKSLMNLPHRYAIRCVDELGLIHRQTIIWGKANSLPESVTDRARRSHEDMLHFTRQPRYYSAVDEIREECVMRPQRRPSGRAEDQTPRQGQPRQAWSTCARDEPDTDGHPLGKLPGSVWTIASQPLNVPERIEHARCCGGRKKPGCADGLTHHAAYPFDLVRPVILGWSPPAVCTSCGEGRRPVSQPAGGEGRHPGGGGTYRAMRPAGGKDTNLAGAALRPRLITGYACRCTPFTGHPGTGDVTGRRGYSPGPDDRPQGTYGRYQAGEYERVGPWREYHFDGWDAPPSRPALVADPFCGTGTTLLVAGALGRDSFGSDLSADYCGLAGWRTQDPAERARAAQVPKPPEVTDGQEPLFDLAGEVA